MTGVQRKEFFQMRGGRSGSSKFEPALTFWFLLCQDKRIGCFLPKEGHVMANDKTKKQQASAVAEEKRNLKYLPSVYLRNNKYHDRIRI